VPQFVEFGPHLTFYWLKGEVASPGQPILPICCISPVYNAVDKNTRMLQDWLRLVHLLWGIWG